MNTKLLNTDFIEAVRGSLPPKTHLSHVLMDVLNIGKEAIYRRLRSEVPFTFAEVATISKALGISLDHLSAVNVDNMALFNLHIMKYADPFETYYHSMKDLLQNYNAVKNDPGVEWYTASNTIPDAFYMDHEYLSKFLLYKWMYQQENVSNVKYFADMEVPFKIREMQGQYVEITQSLASATFIWDKMMFLSLVNDLRYFYDIKVITEQEKKILKEELLAMIDQLELLAARGEHRSGKKVNFYVSNINFEATYSYLSTKTFKFSSIRLYSINAISTTDWNLFDYQKDWIQSLRKYSTLISVSGEMQRVQFLEKQRALVNEL
jgi:DNA-binding phage protein